MRCGAGWQGTPKQRDGTAQTGRAKSFQNTATIISSGETGWTREVRSTSTLIKAEIREGGFQPGARRMIYSIYLCYYLVLVYAKALICYCSTVGYTICILYCRGTHEVVRRALNHPRQAACHQSHPWRRAVNVARRGRARPCTAVGPLPSSLGVDASEHLQRPGHEYVIRDGLRLGYARGQGLLQGHLRDVFVSWRCPC